MTKPRVLIVDNSIDLTGALNSIMRSCSELKGSFDFFFVLPKGSKAISYVHALEIPVHVLPMKELRKNWISVLVYFPILIMNAFRFRNLVKRQKIDLVLSNDFYNLIPPLYSLFGGVVQYICYVRFRPSKFPSILVRFWCWFHHRYAAAVIAVSNIVKTELPHELKAIVIGNEVPNSQLTFTTSTSTTILYPANYIRGKGHEFALRSFADIRQRHPQWRLKFVGSDMGLKKNKFFKEALIQEATTLGLTDAVEWGDFEKSMSTQYINAAIVLNFSVSESFSLSCLEAMFYGRPIISTRCGGPEEIIDDGITGLMVDVAAIPDMAETIEFLIKSPAKREDIGRAAFTAVRQKYSYENTVGKLKQLYDSLLSQQSFNTR